MKNHTRHLFALARLATLCAAVGGVSAQAADRSGREVVAQVCAACHASGKDGAPRIGNMSDWTPHTQKGLAKLTENAIAGIGKMPAHGGQPNLTDLEMSRAIAFMVSAGQAADPSKSYASPTSISGEKLVQSHCVTCHGPGKNGAPRLGTFADWKPRLPKGLDALTHSAIKGHNTMPSRAGLASLSDTDLRNAVTYMVVFSATSAPKS